MSLENFVTKFVTKKGRLTLRIGQTCSEITAPGHADNHKQGIS